MKGVEPAVYMPTQTSVFSQYEETTATEKHNCESVCCLCCLVYGCRWQCRLRLILSIPWRNC